MNPEISVVIPTYNRSETLPRAINSIVSQSFQNWELIIVDDCSTDNTFDIVKVFTESDVRIHYRKLVSNSGANSARNFGGREATAEILSFLDSDDEMHHSNLQNQLNKFLNDPELGLCYTGVDYYSENKVISEVHPQVRGSLEIFLFTNLKGLGSSTSGFSIRKSVFINIDGFDEKMVSQQDLDMLVRVARFYSIDFVVRCNTKMHLNSGNRISDNYQSVIKGEVQFMEKHEQRIRELGLYHHVARKLARKYALFGNDLGKAYSMLFKAIRYRPTYFYAYLYALKLPFLYIKR